MNPILTIGRRRFYIVRAPYGDLLDSEGLQGRRMLTARWIVGPWRLVVTGTRAMYADRRARYLNRITGQTRARRAVR